MAILNRILDVAPHYVAMLVLIFAVLTIVRTTLGDVGFWIELIFVLLVAFAYPPLVRAIGVAPNAWQTSNRE